MPRKVESLPLLPTPLLELHCPLTPLCCRPRTWPKLRESLHQAQSIGSHHCHAQSPPNLPHHLAKLTWSCLPPLGSVHCCNPGLSKHEEKFVQVWGKVSPRPRHQLTILQPPKVPKPCNQRTWWWLQLAFRRRAAPWNRTS